MSWPARLAAILVVMFVLPVSGALAKAPQRAAGPKAAKALAKLERIKAGRDRAGNGRELSPLLRELAVGYGELSASDRKQARSFLARPDGNPASTSDPPFADYSQVPTVDCRGRFCVHFVNDAGDPDGATLAYIDEMFATLNTSADVENVTLGWPAPVSDGALGGNALTDVYVLDLNIDANGILGYAAPDPQATQVPGSTSLHAYLVMDNDYAAQGLDTPEERNRERDVTAAHEYNHILQYGIDVLQDPWMFEATAVWMEDKVLDSNNSYNRFVTSWSQLAPVPLTLFTQNLADPASEKAYGDAVWNHWIEQRYGADAVRQAWVRAPATNPPHFSLAAWDDVIRSLGGAGFNTEFACFAAATGEWLTAAPDACAGRGAAFPDAREAGYADMQRVTSASPALDGPPVSGALDHTAFALFNLPGGPAAAYKLIGNLPPGTSAAIAFIGRTGTDPSGPATIRIAQMPSGGTGSVLVEAPASFSRLTAVLINSDRAIAGFSTLTNDWAWEHDAAAASVRVSSDVTPPGVVSRTPAPEAPRAAVTSRVIVKFSEAVTGVDGTSFVLVAPGLRPVPADVVLDASRSQATLVPRSRLAQHTRYTAQLTAAVADQSDNHLAPVSWGFRTIDLPPAFALSGASRQRAKDVRKRGVKVLVRSTDTETITVTLRALAPGKRAGRAKKLKLRPRARRTVRLLLSPAAKTALAAGRRVKVKVSAAAKDAGGKRKTRTRTVTISP